MSTKTDHFRRAHALEGENEKENGTEVEASDGAVPISNYLAGFAIGTEETYQADG